MSETFIHVGRLGTACVPERFGALVDAGPVRIFAAAQRAPALRFLRRGGAAVIDGDWEAVDAFRAEALRRARDLNHRTRSAVPPAERILTTLARVSEAAGPALAGEWPGLLGEPALPQHVPTLVGASWAAGIVAAARDLVPAPAISADLFVPPDVPAPRSHPTIDVMVAAIAQCRERLPPRPRVLDMGCGSGVLSIAAWQRLRPLGPRVVAADILPEALAATRINVARLADAGLADAAAITTAGPASLFGSLAGETYDLIVFNAPWVNAPTRSRAELATNDAGQRTVGGFLAGCPRHLAAGGMVLLGFSDNAGPRAWDRLQAQAAAAGLRECGRSGARIHTHRSRRAWQRVWAVLLAPYSIRNDISSSCTGWPPWPASVGLSR